MWGGGVRSDRELLELAAKAAGYVIDQRASFMTWRYSRRLALLNPQGGHTIWNAGEDAGDELRLAVKAGLIIGSYAHFSTVDFLLNDRIETVKVWHSEASNDDCAATLLAIVRAAAAIGEQMP